MRQTLAGLIFGLALLVFGPAAAQDIPAAEIRDVQQAVVWRAAGLRLRVVVGDMAEVMRGPALGAALEDWRRSPEQANPGQEVAAVVAGAEIWLAAIEARMAYAQWPRDRPAEVYRREAELTLAQARFDLGYASGSRGSPARPLAMIFMVDGWTRGISYRANPFNDLDAEADAMLVAMLPTPSGAVAGAGAQPGSPGSTPYGSAGSAGGGVGAPGAYGAAPGYPPVPPPGGAGSGYGGAPVVGGLQAAWGGFAGDLTGVGGSGQPDGQTDGMVLVTLPSDGRRVGRIDVYAVSPQGQRTDGHWTTWSAGHWIIAVVIGDRRVSPPTLIDNLQAPAGPMVLFLANGGYLRDGDQYYVEVTFTDGSRATGPFTIGAVLAPPVARPGVPTGPAGGIIDFNQPAGSGSYGGGYGGGRAGPVAGGPQAAWGGFGGDLASPNASGKPDGAPDGRIYVQLPADRRVVRRVDVYGVSAQGQRTSTRWSSWNSGYWGLSVSAGGGQVNPGGPVDSLGFTAQTLTVSVADDGSLKTGARFEVEITYADGSIVGAGFVVSSMPTPAPVGGTGSYGSAVPAPPGGVIDFNQPSGASGGAGGAPAAGSPYPGGYDQPDMSPPGAPAAVGVWAAWSGHVGDLTGIHGSGRPDGQTDGMVSLTLPADGRRIARIDVHGVNDTGQRVGDRWTTWNAGNWLMAVVAGDQRINPDQIVGNLGAPSGRIVLFLGNGGYLTSGRRFEVEVVYTDGAVARAWFTIGQARSGSQPPVTIPGGGGAPAGGVQAAWRGYGGDEISAGVSGQPDGQPDGAITLQFPGERRFLKRIDIYAVDEQGQRSSSHWSSWDGVHWLMALRARDLRLNPKGAIDNLGLPAQPLTALVTNDGSLKPGQRLEVEVTFTDGSTVKGYAVVTP